jgi:glutamine---fructose-6-phosphate transaminase (isomerizing)
MPAGRHGVVRWLADLRASSSESGRTNMCGIFGYVGDVGDAAGIVHRALERLEYRGYDSWGIAVAAGGHAALHRRVGKVGRASPRLPASRAGLGHTRWATHGGVTEANAHPQLGCDGRFAVVHNGMVTNHHELRALLGDRRHAFRSQTDTEVIVHLLEEAFEAAPLGRTRLVEATMAVFRKLGGLNAIVVLDAHEDQLAAAKSGSPLVLGWCERGAVLASDHGAVLPHTRRVTFVHDQQAVRLDAGGVSLFDIRDGRELTPEVSELEPEAPSVQSLGDADFMLREIAEQPAVLRRVAVGFGQQREVLVREIAAAHHVFIVGCGSAAHAALAAQYMFARVANRRVTIATGSEFAHLLPFIERGSLVLALSQSGETIDLLEPVQAARQRGARVVALVNQPGSSLSRLADVTVPLLAGPERCVLSTKAFTAKLATLLLLCHALRGELEVGRELVGAAADEIEQLLGDERRAHIRDIATLICRREHLFVIGRGPSYPMALEAALKIKEVSYIHAEGFAGGELKHGVMALIEPGVPCLVLAPDDETRADAIASATQVRARGGLMIGISPRPDRVFDLHIDVAALGEAHAIAGTVPAQLLGYELARLRGCDPDRPRNLAKSVTVK